MKIIYYIAGFVCVIMISIANLYSSERKPAEQLSSTTTITYNIPYFNESGYYTIDTGGSKTTGDEFTLRVIDDKGKVVLAISPSIIEARINKMKEHSNELKSRGIKNAQRLETTINILDKMKEAFQDPDRIKAALSKLKSYNSDAKGNSIQSVPWAYTINTIRDVSLYLSGTIY